MGLPLFFRLTLALLSVAVAAPAQGGEETVQEVGNEDMRRRPEGRGDRQKGEKGEKGEKGDIEEENLTPEQRLARNITSGAQAYCRFQAALKPAKLMPGQTGTLLVTAVLQGNAVLPAPAPLELTSSPQQGKVTLGGLMVRPAEIGRGLAKGYTGRPVYDNYAIFELPVTLAADAAVGTKHMVSVDLKFDLYDGNTAQAISRFVDRIATEIEVGPVADPAIRSGARPVGSGAAAPAPKAEPVAPAPLGSQAAPAGSAAVAGQPELVQPAASASVPPAPSAPSAVPPPAELTVAGDELPIVPLAIGGGILLLLIVLLLARKK
jgi:hypothetical protein